jgi:hypothetical protein
MKNHAAGGEGVDMRGLDILCPIATDPFFPRSSARMKRMLGFNELATGGFCDGASRGASLA